MAEIPILMVLLARIMKPTVNRWANLVAIPLTAAFIIGGGSASPHYLFLAAIAGRTRAPHQVKRRVVLPHAAA